VLRSTSVPTADRPTLSDDEVTLPVTGHRSVLDLCWALGDHDHAGDLASFARSGSVDGALRVRSASSERAPGGARRVPARRGTDRSSRDSPTSSDRPGTRGASRRAISSGDHHCSSHSVTFSARRAKHQLGSLRAPRSVSGITMGLHGPVVVPAGVGGHLAGHRRDCPTDQAGDSP